MISEIGIVMKFNLLLLLLCVFFSGDVEARCLEREREALLSFKNGLIDESVILSTWRQTDDCCQWYGVVCSNTTGHVIHLELGTADFEGVLRGEISSSLLELHHLTYLDLSNNDFGGNPIPEFIGSMKQLQHLDLRDSEFSGIIPPQLGNLTNLQTLSLSRNSLRSHNLNWLSTLSLLSYLTLGGNDFRGLPIPEFIGSMKQLQELYLWGCNFSGIVPQLGNLSNLLTLVLSSNSLRSENLNWLENLSLLSYLDLSDSLDLNDVNLQQQILKLPSLQELHLSSCNITDVTISPIFVVNSSLSLLDLSSNHLGSSAFDWLSNASRTLVKLDLSNNALGGQISDAFQGLINLEYLDLSSNMLEGEIPTSLGNLSHLRVLVLYDNNLRRLLDKFVGNLSSKLEILDLALNHFTGSIPDFRPFSALTELYLDSNKFTGSMPVTLGQLSKLCILEASKNYLKGTVSESHFMKLHNLKVLDLSDNSLKLQFAPDWVPPFQLDGIYLEGCNLGPSFPKWIQTQRNFTQLDLSRTGIIDEVPKWLWSTSPSFKNIFLSHNQISGTIPDLSSSSFEVIDVTSNRFSGPIPLFHRKTYGLLLSQNMFHGSISSICEIIHGSLMFIDLSNNLFSGEVPNCWEKEPNLFSLNLGNNSFTGQIPQSLGSLSDLRALQLRDNNLSGQLPSTLRYCKKLGLIDVEGNKLTGHIPTWINANIYYLNFRSNRFYGSIPPQICSLSHMRILDISRNNLSGNIPDCFMNITLLDDTTTNSLTFGFWFQIGYNSQLPNMNFRKYIPYSTVEWKGQEKEYRQTLILLRLIDFSSNRLTGNIPKSFSSMIGLISLNLSRNSLKGNIIPDIGRMEKLECLDLSHNQLSGAIPKSLADLHFLAVLDLSNNRLSDEIPSSTQLQGFNTSSYAGNDGLCGSPLPLCPKETTPPQGEDINDGSWRLSFMQDFGISMAFGFIVGFWGVVGSFILKKTWRRAYFNLVDTVGDWFYVTSIIFLSKFRH